MSKKKVKGIKGATGGPGIVGQLGNPESITFNPMEGVEGKQGPIGIIGIVGEPGEMGEPGEPGPIGIAGAPGPIDEYNDPRTPELKAKDALREFLEAWKAISLKKMHHETQKTYKVGHTVNNLKSIVPGRIKAYKIMQAIEVTSTVFDIKVQVKLGGAFKIVTARMICEIEPFKPSELGEWGVNPISLLKGLN